MLRMLVAAADDQQRAVPYLRYAAEPMHVETAVAAEAVQASSSPAVAPPTGGGSPYSPNATLRMVVRPGTTPAVPPGSPGQPARVAVASNTPRRGPNGRGMSLSSMVLVNDGDASLAPEAFAPTPEAIAEAEKAFEITIRANKLIAGGLHNCPDWAEVRDLYFGAAAHFQCADLHCEAGEAFSNAAAISRVYGSELEVATAAGYAVDSFKIADPMKAISLLDEIMDIHHRANRQKLEAKAAKEIAELYESLGELHLALEHYKRATALYAKNEITRHFHIKCLEKVAKLSATTRQFRAAMETFEQLTEIAIRGTRVTERYLCAMLCILADAEGERQAATLAKAKVVFDRYQDYDEFFQKGVEYKLIRGIIAAFDKGSLATFDETQKAFFEFRPKDEWTIEQLDRIRNNLFQYVLPYM
jgi:tetratricopeptide (TPR) repeat protein